LYRKLLLIICSLLLFTACSSKENNSKETMVDTEPIEELSPLEEISKVCLNNTTECKKVFKEKSNLIDKDLSAGKEAIEEYLLIMDTLISKNTVTEKMDIIEKRMKNLKGVSSPTLSNYNRKMGNEYHAQLLEDVIYPLTKIYNTRTVEIGMENYELILSMGYPNKINKTTTANGVSEQWVYQNFGYVYLEDGTVTSFQNWH